MADFLSRVQSGVKQQKKKNNTSLAQGDLQQWGLRGIQLRSYQLDGVSWFSRCLEVQQGSILGDEMGLGKTCQTIALLVYVSGALGRKGPFLVLSPLSVLENWRRELECFAPSLKVLCYKGDKDRRAAIQRETDSQDFQVLLTTYELCLKDASFLKRWRWKVLVVDEAHRLKNQNSLLHGTLTQFSVGFRVLLTGTPIQNNVQELYSLLNFIQPDIFPADEADGFVKAYSRVQSRPALAAELQSILEPFLLRRVKSQVALDLPRKTELVVYHGMSALQKKYYKAVLTKDLEAFGKEQGNRNRLLNILMNLRKCVDHPYLFHGVEPEPFEMGEHLVEASGKLCLLDRLLGFLHRGGHRVLLFSQMTRMLDILQDYLEYRGLSYERLDGSVRGEERNLAVKNFSSKDVFVFLLSTKAGGVGLNLTAADTVVFVDSDFNPQNDLQAAARCHRIGQTRPVKVIRLLARDTVEDVMFSRAKSKLKLTDAVIQEGRFSLLDQDQDLDQDQAAAAGLQLSEILKFGVDKLLSSEESSVQEVRLETVLGPSADGHWLEEEEPTALREEEEEEGEEEEEEGEEEGPNHMYYFEGRDYSKDPSADDQRSFQRLMEEQLAEFQKAAGRGEHYDATPGAGVSVALGLPSRKRKPLTEAELELRRRQREEAAAKRAKLQEDLEKKKAQEKHQKKMAWWESCRYKSRSLPPVDSDEEEEEEEEEEEGRTDIQYVLGDVTHPHAAQGDAIIVHCVDDSGRWGRGGLFTALELRSDEPRRQYELAGRMKDLGLGNVLLFPIDDKQSRTNGEDKLALIVAQQRDKDNNLSGIFLTALDDGLRKISAAARRTNASVHLPRIGHATRGFNWYGTERLIRKHLASRRVATFIYYHGRVQRKGAVPPQASSSTAPPQASSSAAAPPQASSSTAPPQASSSAASAPSSSSDPETTASRRQSEESEGGGGSAQTSEPHGFMKGVRVFFYNLPASDRKRLARDLLTYEGEEEETMTQQVSHVVAELEGNIHFQELRALVSRHRQAVPVETSWLDACFSSQQRVDHTHYLHQLQ